MRRSTFRTLVCCLVVGGLWWPMVAAAQVSVSVSVPAPVLEIQVSSPLVWIVPGVWALPDSDHEVFYSSGWYWAFHDDHWFRSRGRHHGWGSIHDGRVPRRVRHLERGRYRHWHPPQHARVMQPRGWQQVEQRSAKIDRAHGGKKQPKVRAQRGGKHGGGRGGKHGGKHGGGRGH